MRFLLHYSFKNLKSNKAKALLVVFSIFLVSILFFVSLALPVFLNNAIYQSAYQKIGDSDIYAKVYTTDINRNIYSLKDIDRINGDGYTEEHFDYAIGVFVVDGKYVNNTGEKTVVTSVATTLDDITTLKSSVRFVSAKPNSFGRDTVIITDDLAQQEDLHVGSILNIIYDESAYEFLVCGIIKNEGIITRSNSPTVLISKDFVKEHIFGSIFSSSIFNTGIFKVKDGFDKNEVTRVLHETYPFFDVKLLFSDAENAATIKTINYIYNICAGIGILFSMLVILLTMNLVFSSRVKEFARLRALGANNKQLFFSSLFESGGYGFLGGVIAIVVSMLMYIILNNLSFGANIFYGLKSYHFILPVLFGTLISILSGLWPALKSLKQSLRSQMVKSVKFDKKIQIFGVFCAILLVICLILMFALKTGQSPITQLILFVLLLALAIYLVPIIIKLFVFCMIKLFKNKSFLLLHLNKDIFTPASNMVSRIICFALAFLMILSVAVSTVENVASSYAFNTNYNAYILNVNEYSEEMIENIKAVDGVIDAYESVKFKYIKFEEGEVIYESKSLSQDDFVRLYGEHVDQDTIEYYKYHKNSVVLNIGYKYLKNLKVGDTINIVLNESFVYEYEVAGFFDSNEKAYSSAVFRLDRSKEIYGDCGGDYRLLLKVDQNKFDDIEKTLFESGILDDSAEVVSTSSRDQKSYNTLVTPINLIKGYMALIGLLCILSIFVGLCIAIREEKRKNNILFNLGMVRRDFNKHYLAQLLLISIISIIVSAIVVTCFAFNLTKILLIAKVYTSASVDFLALGLISLAAVVMGAPLSLYFAKYSQKVIKEERLNDFENWSILNFVKFTSFCLTIQTACGILTRI